jgi:hypothetical protein
MKRFFITVLVATMVHAVFLVIAPPYEFGNTRLQCFASAFISGIVIFPILGAVVLVPFRAIVRRLMRRTSPRSQTVVVAAIVLSIIAVLNVVLALRNWTPEPHMHGRLGHLIFTLVFPLSVIISFFWPFGNIERPMEARDQAA